MNSVQIGSMAFSRLGWRSYDSGSLIRQFGLPRPSYIDPGDSLGKHILPDLSSLSLMNQCSRVLNLS